MLRVKNILQLSVLALMTTTLFGCAVMTRQDWVKLYCHPAAAHSKGLSDAETGAGYRASFAAWCPAPEQSAVFHAYTHGWKKGRRIFINNWVANNCNRQAAYTDGISDGEHGAATYIHLYDYCPGGLHGLRRAYHRGVRVGVQHTEMMANALFAIMGGLTDATASGHGGHHHHGGGGGHHHDGGSGHHHHKPKINVLPGGLNT